MIIRWSYRRTVKKLGGSYFHKKYQVTTWRVLWILFIPIFAKAIGMETVEK